MNDIPPQVLQLLTAARTTETIAHGPARRDAFRITRFLLAGCLASGITASHLAAALEITMGSIRIRGNADGLVPGTVFASYASINLSMLTTWQQLGFLPTAEPDSQRRTSYPASALVTALLTEVPSTS
jgi:hypothetical protein